MDPKDVQGDILRETQDLLELIRKSYQKKENVFLNLELSYDESLEKVELCEEMLTAVLPSIQSFSNYYFSDFRNITCNNHD